MLGPRLKHIKKVKRVIYHVDDHALFIDLRHVQERYEEAFRKVGPRAMPVLQLREAFALDKLRQIHQPGRFYSLSPGDMDLQFTMRPDSTPGRLPLEDDGGFGAPLPEPQPAGGGGLSWPAPELEALEASTSRTPPAVRHVFFKILSFRPSQSKKVPSDVPTDIRWSDLAVTAHPVVWADRQRGGRCSVSIAPLAAARASAGLIGNAAMLLRSAPLHEVVYWEATDEWECHVPPQAIGPGISITDVKRLCKQMVEAGAVPGSARMFFATNVTEGERQALEHILSTGFISAVGRGTASVGYRLTDVGLATLRTSQLLHLPKRMADLELDAPVAERSNSALLELLLRNNWQISH